MFPKFSTYWIQWTLKLIVPAFLIILVATQALAASACKKVNGKFTLQAVAGPDCLSPVDFCAKGTFSGDFAGTSEFTGSSLIPTVDTPTTGVIFVTGDTMIETKDGTLLTKGAISLSTTGRGEFAEVNTLVAGTGAWAGKSGRFTATGTFDGENGEGTYSGEVCSP